MVNGTIKMEASNFHIPMKVIPGHFATNHSHINYFIDMTTLKSRLSEAREVASALVQMYMSTTVVDTIVCLEETQVIGAYLAEELTNAGFLSKNAHKTIYVTSPEYNSNSQLIFRDNIQPMIRGKNILILMTSVTTGLTINKAVEAIQYYGGELQGICAIFSALDNFAGFRINSVYTKADLPEYNSYDYRNCPYCQKKIKIDALVNSFGYTEF